MVLQEGGAFFLPSRNFNKLARAVSSHDEASFLTARWQADTRELNLLNFFV